MDNEPGSSAPPAPPPPSDPVKSPRSGTSQNKSPSTSRHSPVTPLAPLEYLQNQRRGSITDPSLHAAASHSSSTFSNKPLSLRQPDTLAPSAQTHPPSSYRFGEASSSDNVLPNIHHLLRSPSPESDSPTQEERSPKSGSLSRLGGSNGSKSHDRMEIDSHPTQYSQSNDPHSPPDRPNFDSFDFHARRPSIAGTKRKMSSDRAPGDIDPQLIGPGVPSSNPLDPEGPAPKRRGSAVDTQRIAQLSLYERRNSVDSRPGANGPQWWGNERRDSTSSAFSNTPLTGYSTPSSGFPGDSPHGRPPSGIATFAWPANAHPDQAQNSASGSSSQPPSQSEPNMSGPPQYDPLAMMPPASYAPDRRMSAPAVTAENTPSTGPTRNHRSRSRPPSRVRGRDQTATSSTGDSPNLPPVAAEDASLASASQLNKEPGSTPYSRSPELRISHKLAERKRRKEMKELFDELRDQLPADRGMKASKWEILSKAIDFIVTLKQSHQEMSREIDMLRHDLDGFRQGMPAGFPPGGPPPLYGHGPPVGMPYPPPPPGAAGTAHPHTTQPPPPPPQPGSRPGSSQNSYPPPPAPIPNPAQNGTAPPGGSARTETPS